MVFSDSLELREASGVRLIAAGMDHWLNCTQGRQALAQGNYCSIFFKASLAALRQSESSVFKMERKTGMAVLAVGPQFPNALIALYGVETSRKSTLYKSFRSSEYDLP